MNFNNKLWFLFDIFLPVIIFFMIAFVSFDKTYAQDRIHPSNINLLKKYPRSAKLLYPHIPRISAPDALTLWQMKRALLFYTGAKVSWEEWNIPGSYLLNDAIKTALLNNKLKIPKNNFIIFY